MKFLLDTCIWGGVLPELQALGHDVVWIGSWEKDPGDQEILAIAHREERILATLDQDFGELIFRDGRMHCGIIRLAGIPSRRQAECLHRAALGFSHELQGNAVVTVEIARVRVRMPFDHG